MPLVLMCGYPCSGKTTRCRQLTEYLAEIHPDVKVVVVGDDSLGVDRNNIYNDSKHEKAIRGSLKSEVDKNLTKETVVILDSLNYIKGFRYELFCVSKYARTPHCVICTESPKDTIQSWNSARSDTERYHEEILDELMMRFEPPDSSHRWDSPLFTIQQQDALPAREICDALFHKKPPKPNMSTQNPPLRETDYLYEVDKKTQQIVSSILASQKSMLIGDLVSVPGTSEKYCITQNLTLSQLRRFRQQFLTYVKTGTTTKVADIPKTFLLFLNKCIESC